MSIYQVEEYYLHLDKSEIDFTKKDEIGEFISDNHGGGFEFSNDTLVVDDFECENMAGYFQKDLMEKFPANKE